MNTKIRLRELRSKLKAGEERVTLTVREATVGACISGLISLVLANRESGDQHDELLSLRALEDLVNDSELAARLLKTAPLIRDRAGTSMSPPKKGPRSITVSSKVIPKK
jgi:hypothetical protein